MPHVSTIKSSFLAFKHDVATTSKGSVEAIKTSYRRFRKANGPAQRIKQFFRRKKRASVEIEAAFGAAAQTTFEVVGRPARPTNTPAPAPLPSPERRPVLQGPGDLRRPPARQNPAQAVLGQKLNRRVGLTSANEKIRVSDVVTADGEMFTISQTLGRGTYGKFRLAIGLDEKGKERVWAVKEFRSNLFKRKLKFDAYGRVIHPKTEMTWEKDIYHEVKLGHRVKSPVRIERLVNIQGKFLALMPYMDGGDGFELLSANQRRLNHSGTSRVALALGLMQSVGKQLAYMHNTKYMHGDIKPQNLLVGRDGRFAVADFGGMSRLNARGVTKGEIYTPQYLAPERLSNPDGLHTTAPDAFAVGVSILDIYASAFGYSDSGFGTPRAMLRFDRLRHDFLEKRSGRETATFNASRQTRLGDLFALMDGDLPALSDFMLQHVLNPDPLARATAEQIEAFASHQMNATYKSRLLDVMGTRPNGGSRNDRVLGLLRQPQKLEKIRDSRPMRSDYSYF